jgi:hypothetical protein
VGRWFKMIKQMIAVTENDIVLIEKSQAIEVDCNISLDVPSRYAGRYFFKKITQLQLLLSL